MISRDFGILEIYVNGLPVREMHRHRHSDYLHSIVIAYDGREHEYIVWDPTADGEPHHTSYALDLEQALADYLTRIAKRLSERYNTRTPKTHGTLYL